MNYGYNNGYPSNTNPRSKSKDNAQEQSNGPVIYNNKAGKFLSFNYWGRHASFEIGSVQPGTAMTWDVRKDAQKVSQVVPFENLSELWDIIEEVLDSLKNTGTFTSSGVRVGMKQDAIVEINNGSTINMAPGIYLVIYKNVDSNNRTNNLEVYPFDGVNILRGYDHRTGLAKTDNQQVGQFKKFYRMVKEATKAFTMAQAHTIQSLNRNDRLTTFRVLSALSSAMGVNVSDELARLNTEPRSGRSDRGYKSNQGGDRNYNAPRSGAWSGNSQYGAGTFEQSNDPNNAYRAQPPMATLDDPIDINLSMGDLTDVGVDQFT